MIPLVDLGAQHREIADELNAAIAQTLSEGRFILGPNVTSLENEVAAYCGAERGIGVASGTDALHLALRALGIGPGDEVITSPFTFIATAEAISYCGAAPVFIDIDQTTYNVDVRQIEANITPRTKAILPVHLYGQPADMDSIAALAKKYDLAIVEDCAQAIGAEFQGRPVGALGDAGCLSFFPSKNLGGAGDGGMVLTDNEQLANDIACLRAHGSNRKYFHETIGYNSRLDELQAAILRIKLRRLDIWTEARRSCATLYNQLLSDVDDLATPTVAGDRTHVWHQYTIRIKSRDKTRERLAELGIESAVHYPIPIHLQPAYAYLGLKPGAFPQAEKAAVEVLSLPVHPHLSADEVTFVCENVKAILKSPAA